MTDETKQCPFCAETIKAEAILCRFCGRDLLLPKTANSIPITTATPAMTTKKKNSTVRNLLTFIVVVILACCGISFLSAIFSNTDNQKNESATKSTPKPSESIASQATLQPPTFTPQVLAPSMKEILATVKDMTDAQRNKYMESLAGNRVEGWRGVVSEVDEGEIFGGFTVFVDVVQENFGSEVHFDVSEEVALSLSKGQEIVFSGNINLVSDVLGTTVFIENITIEPVK